MRLTEEEIRTFQSKGYVGPLRALPPSKVEAIADEIPSVLSGADGTHHLHLRIRSVYELCTTPEIVGRISSLIGEDIMLWSSNLFVKHPGDRGTPWHQDQNNGVPPAIEPPLNISVWLAIDDVLAENGCLKFVDGSHLKTVDHAAPERGDYFGRADTRSFDLAKAVDMELQKGEFVIFTDRVLHAAGPNRSNRRRAAIAMRYTTPFVKILRPIKGTVVSGEDRFGFNEMAAPPRQD